MTLPRVKICGLTRRVDVDAAVEAGAWAVGLILWAESPRGIPAAQAKMLTAGLPAEINRVGVLVDATVDEAKRARDAAELTAIQLHGVDDVTPFLRLGVDIIQAVSLQHDEDLARAMTVPREVTILVDAHDPVRRGGTGACADWTRAARLAAVRPVILAGGLHAGNIEEAVGRVRPWAIDVSSGVESAPGVKDAARLSALFQSLPRLS